MSSSAVPSFAIPKLENDTRISNYPGVISGEHHRSQQPTSSSYGKPSAINKTKQFPSMMSTSTHRPVPRPPPHYPPGMSNNYPNFPNDRPIDSRTSLTDIRRQQQQQPSLPKYPYSSYHHESTTRDPRLIQKHPFHPDRYTTPPPRSQSPWWKPHQKSKSSGTYNIHTNMLHDNNNKHRQMFVTWNNRSICQQTQLLGLIEKEAVFVCFAPISLTSLVMCSSHTLLVKAIIYQLTDLSD